MSRLWSEYLLGLKIWETFSRTSLRAYVIDMCLVTRLKTLDVLEPDSIVWRILVSALHALLYFRVEASMLTSKVYNCIYSSSSCGCMWGAIIIGV